MSESVQKLAHTFGALAELGQEISESNDLEVTARTSLHLVLGSVAIMRGAIALYDWRNSELTILAGRGVGSETTDPLICEDGDTASLVLGGIKLISTKEAMNTSAFPAAVSKLLDLVGAENMIPLVVRGK